MGISTSQKRRLAVALASTAAAEAIAALLEGKKAIAIAAIGTTAAVRSDSLANLAADVEARLDVIEGKFDATIAALKAAGLMVA